LIGEVAFALEEVKQIIGWRCKCTCRCKQWVESQCKCEQQAGPCDRAPDERIFKYKWGSCPYGELRHPMWLLAAERMHAAEISPLTGWPDTYSAGLFDAMMAFRNAKAEWMAKVNKS
jgi:hypothetical protein